MKPFLVAAALATAMPLAAASASLACSIKAKKGATKTEQAAMAKVQDEAARQAAIARAAPGSVIAHGGLQITDGCLVYEYETRVPGKGRYQEVLVDAGTGAVLRVGTENPIKERAELVKEKAAAVVKSAEGKEHAEKDPIPRPPGKVK